MRIRMKMIPIGLFLIFVCVDFVPSWAGPIADLLEPGRVSVMGIDYITKAIQSEPGRLGRRLNTRWAGQERYRPEQTSPYQKPSIAQILSDNVGNEGTVQTQTARDGGRISSLPNEYVTAEYFPASPGITWKYIADDTKTSGVKVLPEVAVVRGVKTNIAVNTDTGVGLCYTSDSDGILIHRELLSNVYVQGTGMIDLLVTFIPPIRLADGLVEVGQSAYSIGTAQYTLPPGRRVFDLDYKASYTLQSVKKVTVPAGTISALLFDGTFALSGDFESETFYLAKNIGLIKDEVESNDQKRTKELILTNVGS